jgi:DNA-binding GntR family transcriptional regulator
MTVQRGVAEPESRQLAAILREQIGSGALAPGAQLPSIVRLAQQYQIATATVYKAIRILKAEGLVFGVPGHGTFVSDRP